MTDESYAEPELRAALGTLLADEPAAPPLVDDVARGRALQRRRRARGGALVGLAAVAAAAVVLIGTVRPGTTPVTPGGGTPTASASPEPGQVAAVTAELARLGYTVTAVDAPYRLVADGRDETQYAVRPTQAASGTVSAALTIRAWHPDQVPGERTALPGAVMNGCDGTTCARRTVDQQVCRDGACWGEWTATTTSAYADQVPGSQVVFLADGTSAVEGVATPPTCITCSSSRAEPAFLTAEQLSSILLTAAAAVVPPTPAPSRAAVRACRDGDVKLVPAVDPGTEVFHRSVVIEVHARNPEVRCTVTGYPEVSVPAASNGTAAFEVVDGPGAPGAELRVVVTQESTPAARFTVGQGRCTALDRVPVPALVVTLPGDTSTITVELPAGLAPATCPGGSADSLTLTVTPFAAP